MTEPSLRLVPLGDQAVLAYLEDECAAIHFANAVREAKERWLVEVVSSYATVAVFFDLGQVCYQEVAARLEGLSAQLGPAPEAPAAPLHVIPCCYEFGPDLNRVSEQTGLRIEEIVQLHASTVYTVHAIGFCPGFPYLGYLPPSLCGVPRLSTPRQIVQAGSVGMTGRQTGIYTQKRPGAGTSSAAHLWSSLTSPTITFRYWLATASNFSRSAGPNSKS